MKLTSPSGPPRRASARSLPRALTTEPGFVNVNKQKVVRSTGAASSTRDHQTIYRMHCNVCDGEYGCNGMDIKSRLCPYCQKGVAGEPLREQGTMSLFE